MLRSFRTIWQHVAGTSPYFQLHPPVTLPKRLPVHLACLLVLSSLQVSVSAWPGIVSSEGSQQPILETRAVVTFGEDHHQLDLSIQVPAQAQDIQWFIPLSSELTIQQIRWGKTQRLLALDRISSPRLVEYHDLEPCLQEDELAWAEMLDSDHNLTRSFGNPHRKEHWNTVRLNNIPFAGVRDTSWHWIQHQKNLISGIQSGVYPLPPKVKQHLLHLLKAGYTLLCVQVSLSPEWIQPSSPIYLPSVQIEYSTPGRVLPRLSPWNAPDRSPPGDVWLYVLNEGTPATPLLAALHRMPTELELPLALRDSFNTHYRQFFTHRWQQSGPASVFLEYRAPLLSVPDQPEHGYPPFDSKPAPDESLQPWDAVVSDSETTCYLTRLHFRLSAQVTPSVQQFRNSHERSTYSIRYLLHMPALGPFDCEPAVTYLNMLHDRWKNEFANLAWLTGHASLSLSPED